MNKQNKNDICITDNEGNVQMDLRHMGWFELPDFDKTGSVNYYQLFARVDRSMAFKTPEKEQNNKSDDKSNSHKGFLNKLFGRGANNVDKGADGKNNP